MPVSGLARARSQHASKAPASGIAQFGSFTMCQGPSHDECCMNGASGHRTVTGGGCQVHRQFGYPLSRRHTLWPENMGTPFYIFRAPPLGKETALHVSRVPIWTLWVRLYKTVSTQQVVSGCVLSVWTLFGLSRAACAPWST